MVVELLVDPREVLGVVGEVNRDEGGVGMTRDHALELAKKLFSRRELRRVAEPPLRVILELLPPLVRSVERLPKRARIANVDRDRHPELAAPLPNWVELRVVDAEELAVLVSQVEAQTLELFEPRRAETVALFDLPNSSFGEVRPIPVGVVEVHVLDEAPRIKLIGHRFDHFELARVLPLPRNDA